jgi:phytoene dehydrogenase-like protein
LDRPPSDLGHEATIVFYNDADQFDYRVPDDCIDPRSGVVCCPGGYASCEESAGVLFRSTWLASYRRWAALDETGYAETKRLCERQLTRLGSRFIPDFEKHVEFVDTFTPRTIERYTGHIHGAVYGAPRKRRDGRTHLSNLFICGTDQGFLGIIGAMLSGITIANRHVLTGD